MVYTARDSMNGVSLPGDDDELLATLTEGYQQEASKYRAALKRIADGCVMPSGDYSYADTVLAYQEFARKALA